MSDAENAPEQHIETRLYTFGPWRDADDSLSDATELGKRMMAWMRGESVEMDADLSRVLQREFRAQDLYREAITREQSKLVGKLQARAGDAITDADLPLSPAEAYARGYSQGAYQAYAHAAQDVQDVINAAVVSMR